MNTSHDLPEQPADPTPDPAPSPETDPSPTPQSGAPESAPNEPLHENRHDSAKFFLWIRGLGVQRGSNRWVGGVCSGLANKWGIDPVIVRGLAVVLTLFFGIGVLAYGVAWALLPEPDGRIHTEQMLRGHWSTGMTGAGLLTLVGLISPGQGFIFGDHNGWFPWPLFWIAAVVGVIYWAVNQNKTKSSVPAPDWQKPMDTAQPHQSAPYFATPAAGSTAPGAAPAFAGHYSAQHSYPAQQFTPQPQMYVKHPVKTKPRLGAAASLLALGLAIMVGAIVMILEATNVIDLGGYAVATAAAAAAITAGIAIVCAGILGRAAGGVGTFAIIMLVLAGLLSLPPYTGQGSAFTTTLWAPTTIASAESGRTLVMGNATLDLTKLDDASPLTADVKIPVDLAAAQMTIKVPTSIPVQINSDLVASSWTLDDQDSSDTFVNEASTDLNPEATGYGLIITVQGAASNVTVVRVAGQ
ncbi:PspC domain-containing protein [Specibacter sp. NPDC078709]|uniref:PspC domain-containing protein n=1 Tax=Specibacter sp. NPDC078709 TaxID=3154364 RepID=UPI0034237CAE